MPRPMEIFDARFNNLERAMEIATRRQEVISHNISNAKTPGFEPLTFDERLMQAVKRLDRQEVVLEEELAALTENSVKYSSYVKLLSSKINTLKTIATQGRR
ncbi:flagellar basal body rod protein FlgB [Candidatus Margulisiibacteriota bacterium]